MSFDAFEPATVDVGDTVIFTRRAGSGPPLLLLHGFPETHLMWRDVAPRLAKRFTVVCADLHGYGQSGCPPSNAEHAPYTKRTMAGDLVALMQRLGFDRFHVAGHDRGGRVAARLALDHPDRVGRLAVLDIAPTQAVWQRADARMMLAFWPWSLLAQPAPLPERLITAAPQAVIDDAVSAWDSPPEAFPPDVRDAYARTLADPDRAHAICEEYRAAAYVDCLDDRADLAAGRKIAAPLLALWSAGGAVETWYPEGPLALWRAWADQVEGEAVEGGHFFPEAQPDATADRLAAFFGG